MWGLIPVAMRYLVTELSPQTAMVLRLYPAGLLAMGAKGRMDCVGISRPALAEPAQARQHGSIGRA
jgi:Flp pilus assembly protein TadB